MLLPIFKRYGLVVCAAGYTAALVLLHALGLFPAPGLYDVSRLAGAPALTLEGRVLDFPQTRWGNTRFLMQGHAVPLDAFAGRVVVKLDFPVPDLAPGERLRVRGWLSATRGPGGRRVFNERAYWAGRRTYAALRVWSPQALERFDPSRTSWTQHAWHFHQRFKQFWFERLPYDEAALLSCMTMGSHGILPQEIKNQCVRAGVYHLLVVSGQNMALVIALGMIFLRLLRVPRGWAFWICCLPILFYTCAVGADPPVTRAAAMAIVALGAMAIGRDVPGFYPFVLAWFWILLSEPEALFGASFQLSFGATASLLATLSVLRSFWELRHRLLRWLAEAAVVSLAVHVGIWPLLAYYFQQLSLAGFFANWTLFPLSGCIMMAGLLVGTWGVWSPASVPECLLDAIHQVLRGTLAVIAWMSGRSWAVVALPAPSWTVCGVYYGLLICILVKIKHAKKSTFE